MLYEYLSSNNILYDKNLAFKNLPPLIMLVGVFIGLLKAPDTVNHNILLKNRSKLNKAIKGNNLKLFASYLSNRKQFLPFNQRAIPSNLHIKSNTQQLPHLRIE